MNAALRAAVIAECGRTGDALAEERRGNRDAGAKRLADRHQIRLQANRGGVERPSRPAQTALDLVRDQQRARPFTRIGDCGRHRRAQRPHATFPLDRRRRHAFGIVTPHEPTSRAPEQCKILYIPCGFAR